MGITEIGQAVWTLVMDGLAYFDAMPTTALAGVAIFLTAGACSMARFGIRKRGVLCVAVCGAATLVGYAAALAVLVLVTRLTGVPLPFPTEG